jgi:hypothetical protein
MRMVSGAENGPNRWRVALAAGLSVVALGLVAGSGCGTSANPVSPAPVAVEAGPTGPGKLEQVTTGGGGGAVTSSGGNLFGNLPEDAADEPMEAVLDATSDALASFDGSTEGGMPPSTCVDYVAPTCGFGETCDLRYNTCCVSASLTTRCVAKPQPCEPQEDSVACVQACECPGSQVCCGFYYDLMQVVGSSCQTVAEGNVCQPATTNTVSTAQLCGTQKECTQSECINQTCVDGITLNVCGLQSQDPFDCVSNGADAGPP